MTREASNRIILISKMKKVGINTPNINRHFAICKRHTSETEHLEQSRSNDRTWRFTTHFECVYVCGYENEIEIEKK